MTNREKFAEAFGYDGSIMSEVLPGTNCYRSLGSCGIEQCTDSCASRCFPRCPLWWNDVFEEKGESMEPWKERMINEYKELKDRYEKLHKMLVKYDAGKLEFEPTCPIELLREQAATMGKYLYILEERAVIEGVELG